MKKKIAVLFLASILVLSAAACNSSSSGTTSKVESAGGTTSSASSVAESSVDSKAESKTESQSDDKDESKADESKSETSSSNPEAKNLLKKNYFDIVKDGKYYMSMTMDASTLSSLESSSESSSDTPSEITMIMAIDTDNQKMYVDLGYPMMGFQKIIVADGKQWVLDDTNKAAYYTKTTEDVQKSFDSISSNMVLGSSGDIEKNMKYVSDSVENFNGKDCYAVVYEVKNEASLGEGVSMSSSSGLSTEQTYYFDKDTNKLVGVKTNVMGVNASVIINELTTEIPADLFTVPAGYKQSDMSSMMSAAASAE